MGNFDTNERAAAIASDLQKRHEDCEIKYTYCQNQGCFEGCLLKCYVKDGEIVSIDIGDSLNANNPREDLGDEAIRTGMLQRRPCVRGRMMKHTSIEPERMLYPLKRDRSQRGNPDAWERISWDEAIEILATNIEKTVSTYGPYSILSGIAPSSVGRYYGYGFGLTGGFSMSGINIPEFTTYGGDALNPFVSKGTEANDFLNTHAIIGIGWNPQNTFFQWGNVLAQVHEKGVPVVLVDPRFSPSVQGLADQWIPIRPGTKQALLMAMAYVIFEEGLEDKKFLEDWVEPKGVEIYRSHIFGEDGSTPKTPEWAEKICAVPAESIRELARMLGSYHGYSDKNPCFFKVHWPVSRVMEGENISRAAQFLNILTGNVGVPGTTSNGADLVITPYLPTPMLFKETMQNIKVPGAPQMNCHAIADAIIHRDDVQSGKMDEMEYRRLIGCAVEWPLPNIHMWFNEWGTGWNASNETQRLIEAYDHLDFVAVMHQNMTRPEVLYADLILPIADTHLEDTEDEYNMGGFISPSAMSVGSFSNSWLMKEKIIDPPGEAMPKAWVLSKLAQRLGVIDDFNPRFKDVIDAGLDAWYQRYDDLHRETYEAWRAQFAEWCEANGFDYETEDYDEFKKHPIFRVPLYREGHFPLKENITDGQPFDTPSTKIEMYCDYLAEPGMGDHSVKLASGYEMFNCFGGSFEPAIKPTSIYHEAYDNPIGPLAEEYPMRMISPHSFFRNHSAFFNNTWASDETKHDLWINVVDAARYGIKDGDKVHVTNRKGEAYLDAYVTSRVAPGTVVNFHGAWFKPSDQKTAISPAGIDADGSSNSVTDNSHYPWVTQATHCSGLVRIEKA